MEGTNPLTMSEWLWDSSLSLGGNLDLENNKLLPEVHELHSSVIEIFTPLGESHMYGLPLSRCRLIRPNGPHFIL